MATTDGGYGVSDTTVNLARCGDESAWSVLFKELAPAVAAYFRARRMVEAEDLTGEVFLEVARKIGSFEGGAAGFRAWVFTIAHSRYVDALRSLERRPTASLEAVEEPIAPVDVAGEATTTALRERLLASTDVLSPDQRSVLLLRIFADLSIAETAEAIGKSTVAVKVHLHRAIKALERELAPPVSRAPDVPHRARVGTVSSTPRLPAPVAPTEVGEA